MKFEDFPLEVKELAKEMAVRCNGGTWPEYYIAEHQKLFWAKQADWVLKNYDRKSE